MVKVLYFGTFKEKTFPDMKSTTTTTIRLFLVAIRHENKTKIPIFCLQLP